MNTKPFSIITAIHENTGHWDGRADAKVGRKLEANGDASVERERAPTMLP